ncbi:3'(2'),5'-bisphosphate nucleotidase CysQ [bacterium BMS3Abin07]|nr:3'(2'),5'-bisphosphate nucleotidase CysQ [bacterium BMS3Abin07]HDO21601.1 3'(2'),5'-bisphosphate nucleotidase CysQ [Nitrospirota bacterium]HDZ88038.1 3'(2'),5'-bisphosphate nucleotidase CysQ [Nitrospirota bacterium]
MNKHKYTIDILLLALLAAKKAGEAILEVYNTDFKVGHKDDKSPLTLADKRSHEIITNHITTQPFNQFPVLSEEGRDIPYEERKTWEYFWLVDPLDGTKEFIKRNGEFTVNIALIYRGRPVLGVIYVPVKDTMYFAAEGVGAYKLEESKKVSELESEEFGKEKNEEATSGLLDEIIKSSTKLPITNNHTPITDQRSRITIIGSRSHATKELDEFVEDMKKKYKKVDFISAGSSLKFCLVAEGRADIYPRFGPTMEWDTAAGHAIVAQAGDIIINTEKGLPLEYNKEDLLNPWFVAVKDKNLLSRQVEGRGACCG